ncbi:MAG: Mrp/NBP35 family ATP-binding protein [Brevinematales bacterium]|nr:Mrp/NBP35 family ATP-binding protein [Brevinematales bacterium]
MNNGQDTDSKLQDIRLKNKMDSIKKKIIVMSGKGGVGKTTIAVNIAYRLAMLNYDTGILDTDIHGPNVPKMLGVDRRVIKTTDDGIEPIDVFKGLKAVSVSYFLESDDQPVIWRGPMKMGIIKQFLSDVNWGNLDFLVIDSPPGTGDEPLSVCQLIPGIDGAIIVTSPQEVAVLDARKSIMFAKQLKVPVIGVVENMSGLICPDCGKSIPLYGEGGGEKAAEELGVPFLGKIHFDPVAVKTGDKGVPIVDDNFTSSGAKELREITDQVIRYFNDRG